MKIISLIIAFSTHFYVIAQEKFEFEKNFTADDSTALVAIANCSDSLRRDVLSICQNPNYLVNVELLQKKTSKSFSDLINNYNKEEQNKIWGLTRYPEIISKIITGGKKSKEELKAIAVNYPKEFQSTIVDYGLNHYDILSEINNLFKKSQIEHEKIISEYSKENKASFLRIINHPDVLGVLTSNMHLAVILGNMYSSDPNYTLLMLDSIKIKQDIQNAREIENWKNGLEKNPIAKKEFENAAREFANENELNTNDDDDVYNDNSIQTKPYYNAPKTNTVIQPYPYWFGYPWWYDYPYWYPYPYWYNFGFYWGPTGTIYFGMPSPFFIHWYFYNPHHHYYFSNFSEYCIVHHKSHFGPRYQRTGFNNEIYTWTKVNEPNLPNGFLNSDNHRQSRIRELGRFEVNYNNNTRGIFGKNITRSDFLKSNSEYYPHLKSVISQPEFNRNIKYPKQVAPIKFNMDHANPLPKKNINPKNNIQRQSIQKSNIENTRRKR